VRDRILSGMKVAIAGAQGTKVKIDRFCDEAELLLLQGRGIGDIGERDYQLRGGNTDRPFIGS